MISQPEDTMIDVVQATITQVIRLAIQSRSEPIVVVISGTEIIRSSDTSPGVAIPSLT